MDVAVGCGAAGLRRIAGVGDVDEDEAGSAGIVAGSVGVLGCGCKERIILKSSRDLLGADGDDVLTGFGNDNVVGAADGEFIKVASNIFHDIECLCCRRQPVPPSPNLEELYQLYENLYVKADIKH